jgi:hypothetical protein
MRYAYIHTAPSMTGDFHLIIIERGAEKYQYYSTDRRAIKEMEDSFTYVREELGKKRTRLEDAVGSGYSYYSKEIGKYEGANKRKIDAIIKEHGM